MQLHAKDDNDHTLTALWKTFYSARDNDRPKDEAAALDKIKKEALAKGLSWDYYDACQEYVNTRSRSNWKEYEKLNDEFRKEIEKNAPPVAVFFHRLNFGTDGTGDLGFIKDNRSRMLGEHNPEFYSRDYSLTGRKFSKPLLGLIGNDYEYALLSLYSRKRDSDPEVAAAARSYFSGRYPLNAVTDYIDADTDEEKETFLKKYDSRAAALWMKEDSLLEQFNSLKESKTAGQDDFRLLDAACGSFIKTRDAFSGSEKALAECCTLPDQISKALNAKKVGLIISEGSFSLLLRNVSEASVSFRSEEKKDTELLSRKVKNPTPSFYVTDTVKVSIDDVPDGDYLIYCTAAGVKTDPVSYRKHTLSMAWREDSKGLGAYVAGYLSGEPVTKADFTLRDRSGKILAEVRGLSLDGFTRLPGDITSGISGSRRGCTLQASCKDSKGILRSSVRQNIYINGQSPFNTDEETVHCMLITDRTAFNPEETVHFKAVLFKGYYKYRTCSAGTRVKATLLDPKSGELSSVELKTDDFGSVSSEFFLPRTANNGRYTITISLAGESHVLQSAGIRVDDYVLPTFDLLWDRNDREYHPGDTVRVSGNLRSYSGHNLGAADITYTVSKYSQTVMSGNLTADIRGDFAIEFPTDPSDSWQNYRITVKTVDTTGETREFSTSVYVRRNNTEDNQPRDYFFKELEDEPIALKVVAGRKQTWAVAELHTTGNILLEKRLVRFGPEKDANAETVIRFDYKDSWPDVVSLNVIYFQNGESYEHRMVSRRPDDSWKLPLSFSRFLDTTAPGATYSFNIKTEAGIQCAATVFDKSTETVSRNVWRTISPNLIPAPDVYFQSACGSDLCHMPVYDDWIGAEYGMPVRNGRMMMKTKAAGTMMLNDMAMAYGTSVEVASMRDDSVEVAEEEEAIPFPLADNDGQGYIRENFANTIAWEPCLRSDKDGNIIFTFTNADKLSTYYVQLFAHDRDMRNAVLRKEMKVTLPVKIAVIEPQILYDGDKYVMRATLSNSTSTEVPGTAAIEFYDGSDYRTARPVGSDLEKLTVPAGGSASFEKEIDVRSMKDLGIKLTFTPDSKAQGADGVFVSIPVLPAVQTITEAHSSLFFAKDDRNALIESLRGQFVNFPGSEASVREISILDMLKEAVPERVEPKSDNAVALTEALYAGMLADGLNGRPMKIDPESEILAKILKLQTPDGGFAWFEGMEASPVLTCLVLERFHRMGLSQGTEAAVKYIDGIYFRKEAQPLWRGWISQAQYLYIRSLYAGVDFSSKDIDSKVWKEFRKSAKSYLVPAKVRGLNGAIFAKARRVETLRNLLASDDGLRLASRWGIKLAAGARLESSLAKDIESLSQYVEPHKSGGMYFPNAVMPFRGLLESEAYAHSHLCRLMAQTGHGDIADGVRLWLMVQKETQKWDSDPGFLEALHAVFEGSDEMLATKVIALKGSTELPFARVKAAGNGFTVERQYFKDGKEIADGETLKVGDRISAVYKVWNGENRSFVKLTAPRNAALKPVDQLSGYHWGYYRNVLKDRTEYWYQSYPEEKTEVREEFYVQQAGTFQSAALEIVCEYADHYRANDAGRPAMVVER